LVDYPGEGTTGFLEWGLIVRTVRKNNIHVVELESFEAVSGAFNDMFPGHERLVDFISDFEQLGADYQTFSLQSEFLESITHLNLRLSASIDLGSVVKIDPTIEAQFNGVFRKLVVGFTVRVQPVAETKD